jgi:DNA polymerase III subunit delta
LVRPATRTGEALKQLTIIASENEFLASIEIDRLRAPLEQRGFSIEELTTDDTSAIFNALDTQSLFGGGRCVIVRGAAAPLDVDADRLASWAESPPPEVTCIVAVGSAAKLRKALGARAEVIDVAAPKPWETADWLVRFLKGRGRVMARDAAGQLVEAIGSDLRELATAAEQLALSTKGSITVEVVSRMFRGLESQLYTFLEALLQRDRDAALRHLGALMRSGEHPLVMMNALAKQFRAVAAVRDAGRPNAAAVAKELDLTIGYVNRAIKHARNFDAGDVRRAFRVLADADFALKGGERGEEASDTLLMEMLVAELAGSRGPTAVVRQRR